eukprot:TRINITY_DN6139_c0_g1_i6.p1 TRINITY_DN6139_c0_g1~~TRINITY_DN6139_c0_g1_i6.p1  ORF type:complete len:434 (+),score=38.09 TRINITY_DN6139_c0_g1_i6:154-1302(+)
MSRIRKALNNFNQDLTSFTDNVHRHIEQLQLQIQSKPTAQGYTLGSQIRHMKGNVEELEEIDRVLLCRTLDTTSTEELKGATMFANNAIEQARNSLQQYLTQYGYVAPEVQENQENFEEDSNMENVEQNNLDEGYSDLQQAGKQADDSSALDSEFGFVSTPTLSKGRSSGISLVSTPLNDPRSMSTPAVAQLENQYGGLSVSATKKENSNINMNRNLNDVHDVNQNVNFANMEQKTQVKTGGNSTSRWDWGFTPVVNRTQPTPFPRSPMQFTPGTLPIPQPHFTAKKQVPPSVLETQSLQYASHGEYNSLQPFIKKYLSYEQLSHAITGLNKILETGTDKFTYEQLDQIMQGQQTKNALNALVNLDKILQDLDDQNFYRILV